MTELTSPVEPTSEVPAQLEIDPVTINADRERAEASQAAEMASKDNELILGKFKTQEDFQEAYKNLEREFSKYGKYKDLVGAPEENYSLQELIEKKVPIKADDPVYSALSEVLKTAGVSQKVHDSLVEAYYTSITDSRPKMEDEVKKLGDNGQELITNLSNWTTNAFSADEQGLLDVMVGSFGAPAIQLLSKIKGMTVQQGVPATGAATQNAYRSTEEIKAEMNKNMDRYGKDPAYRKKIYNELEASCRK